MKATPTAFNDTSSLSEEEHANFARLLDARHPIAQRISSILLPVELTRAGDRLVRQAVIVANLLGARLIGLARFAGSLREGAELEAAHVLARAAAARFEILSRSANARCQCVTGDGSSPASLGDWAWSAELVMLARKRSEPWSSWETQLRNIIRRTCLPILVTEPGEGCFVLDHVVVIWSETAASREAIRAALPFLGRATTVTLLAPPWRRDLPAREHALDAVRRGLLSRNIQPAVVRLDHRLAGGQITDHVAGLTPDLVVAAMPKSWPFREPRHSAADLDRLRVNLLVVG